MVALPRFLQQACAGETFALDMLHCVDPIESSYIWEYLHEHRTKFYSKDMKAYIGYVKKQAAKYGLKGTRLADIKKVMQFLERCPKDFTLENLMLTHEFPEGEYIRWTNYRGKGAGAVEQIFYEVNTKKYQITNTVEYVLEQITKMWDGYGERAKQAEKNEGVYFKALSHALRAGYQARDIYKDGDFEYPLKETEFLLSVKKGELDYKTEIAPVLEELVDEVNILAERSKLPKKVDASFFDEFLLDIYL